MSLSNDQRLRIVAKKVCRDLRRNQTAAEKKFWDAVRNRKILGYKFYRQYPIFYDYIGKETFFVVDFYCHQRKVVVEIDGKIHKYKKERDRFRTFLINMLGIKVIRYQNEEIENNIEMVLEDLKRKLM